MILDLAWKTFDTLYALDSLGNYWLENERLIQMVRWRQMRRRKVAVQKICRRFVIASASAVGR